MDLDGLGSLLAEASDLARSATTPEQRQQAEALLNSIEQEISAWEIAGPSAGNVPAPAPEPVAPPVEPGGPSRQTDPHLLGEPGELVGVNPEAAARIRAQAMLNPDIVPEDMQETPFAQLGEPEQVRAQPGRAERIAANISQGMSLGFAPRIQRAIGAEETAQRLEDVEESALQTNPVESITAQLAGTVANPISIGTGILAAGARTAPRAIGIGVLGSGLEGAAEARGREMDTYESAANVGINAALPFVGGVIGSMVGGGRRALTSRPNQEVAGLIEESGLTPQQMQGALTQQPETLPEVAARVSGVRNVQETPLGSRVREFNTAPGTPRQVVSENLQARAEGAQSRVESIITGALGGERAAIDREAAGQAYDAFRAHPWPTDESRIRRFVETDDDLRGLLPEARKGWRADNREAVMAGADEATQTWNWQTMDELKRQMDSQISVARRAGDNAKVRRLTKTKNDFVNVLEESNPAYADARRIFADGASKEQAQTMGSDYFRKPRRDTEIEADFAKLSEAEQDQFRIGALDELLSKVETTAGRDPDYTRRLINTPAAREKLRFIAKDPDQLDDMINRLVVEGRGQQAAQQILGGPSTAPRLTELGAQAESLVRGVMNLNFGDAAASVMRNIADRLPGPPRQREQVARMLSESDPQEVRRILGILADTAPDDSIGQIGAVTGILAPSMGAYNADQ